MIPFTCFKVFCLVLGKEILIRKTKKYIPCFNKIYVVFQEKKSWLEKLKKEYFLFEDNLSYAILFLENVSCMKKQQLVLRFFIFFQQIRNVKNPSNKEGN